MISKIEWEYVLEHCPYLLITPSEVFSFGTRLIKVLGQDDYVGYAVRVNHLVVDWKDSSVIRDRVGKVDKFYLERDSSFVKVLTTTGPVSVREWLDANYLGVR